MHIEDGVVTFSIGSGSDADYAYDEYTLSFTVENTSYHAMLVLTI